MHCPLLHSLPWPHADPLPASGELKVAVTEMSALIVSEQLPLPVQAPAQPSNVSPGAAVALRMTVAPSTNDALAPEQDASHAIAAGTEPTLPAPEPAFEKVSERSGPIGSLSPAALFAGLESL